MALPVHLYLTVTEACNSRCRHCINRSPALTQSGRAREMRPWLIERLRDGFAAADYFGFAHGGESLLSPVLFDLLDAIAREKARRSGSWNAHLLTNGMLLTAEVTQRLVDHGVTSLAVSLDGATEKTNDALRLGSSFHTVVANVRDAVKVRRAAGADLRIGISTVVTASNLAELDELARLTIDLGVDWLKLEEMHPASAACRAELVPSEHPALLDAVAQVRQILAATDVVLLDHLEPRSGCDCQARDDPALRAFRQADDFANRARFHPCRAAWEQACIDPDGTVHPVDYHHEAIGNLLEASLFELWDGPAARRLRRQVLERFPAELRARCPIGAEGESGG